MKSKKTKKALSGSILALVLCFVMLIGTTFAWFTSSDSTAVNQIKSGTLKVELQKWNGSSWVGAEGQALEFERTGNTTGDILWEPGCTYTLPKVKIVNMGNLALKYKVVVSAVLGDGNLAEVLDVLYSDSTKTELGEVNVGTLSAILNSTDPDGFAHGNLAANGESGEITLSLHMQELAGNAYQNKSISGIAITVYATQDTVEYDSNGNTYDKDATLPATNAVAVKNLATEATKDQYVVLTDNVSGAATMASSALNDYKVGFSIDGGTFDGNGNTVSATRNDVGIEATSGTIQNVTVNNVWRGIMTTNTTGDITIDNAQILNCGYAINTGSGTNNDAKLIVTNSTLNGWTSFDGIASASFTNCSFGTSTYYSTETWQHLIRPYVNATFTNCDFEAGFYIQLDKLAEGNTITLKDCTCNGVKLTNDNFADYVKIVTGFTDHVADIAQNGESLTNVIFQ